MPNMPDNRMKCIKYYSMNCAFDVYAPFQNAFPVSGLFSTHLLSLDALLTVVDSIEQHCHSRILKATAKPSDEGSGMKSEGSEVMGSAEGQSHSGVKEDGLVGHSTNGFAMGTKVIQGKEASIGKCLYLFTSFTYLLLLSSTGETEGDLWCALCASVSQSVSQSVSHIFLDPAITLKVLHIFS
ncbi:hypothetical protein DPMN_181031 [Dreissena polymorpha]|uniref:Uncharacterized protein n=1 Tax=Dreissena polymorpha TaxID=45954 RepID=A0A9D4I4X7_DREPO|nr:hypothetical protein DPMN_181031 [Dreissena polymorpha]